MNLHELDQTRWGLDFLHQLCDLDTLQILNVHLLLPDENEGATEGKVTSFETGRDRIYTDTSKLSVYHWIHGEWTAEAGDMLVSVCGSPKFEAMVRNAVCSSNYDIALRANEFQPDIGHPLLNQSIAGKKAPLIRHPLSDEVDSTQ